MNEKPCGLVRIFKATQYSWQGLQSTFYREPAFRQELFLVAILSPIGLFLGQTGTEKALLVGVLLLVLIMELFNSAIEAIIDEFGGGRISHLSGFAKDASSAAVLVAIVNAVTVWILILFIYLSQ